MNRKPQGNWIALGVEWLVTIVGEESLVLLFRRVAPTTAKRWALSQIGSMPTNQNAFHGASFVEFLAPDETALVTDAPLR